MVKLSGYMHFVATNRDAHVAEITGNPEHAELSSKDRNQLVMKLAGAKWSALDDEAKAKHDSPAGAQAQQLGLGRRRGVKIVRL